MMTKRSFFKSVMGLVATVALAPEIAFGKLTLPKAEAGPYSPQLWWFIQRDWGWEKLGPVFDELPPWPHPGPGSEEELKNSYLIIAPDAPDVAPEHRIAMKIYQPLAEQPIELWPGISLT